jgi:hypothetical protein
MNLLGRSLKTFFCDFTTTDYGEGLSYLGEDETWWIQTLAKTAIEYKTALKTIRVKYSMVEHCRTRPATGYPWEYLNETRDKLSKLDINLVYDEPRMSKDEWLQYFAIREDPHNKIGELFDYGPVKNVVKYQVSALSKEILEEEEMEKDLSYKYLRRSSYQREDIRRYSSTKLKSSDLDIEN